jgi:hypothetical protein
MRILIQHIETRLYLGKGCRWILDPQCALAFLDEVRARDYCIYRRLTKATVVALPEDRPQERPSAQGGKSLSIKNKHEIENMKPKPVTSSKNTKTQPGSTATPKASPKGVEPTSSVSTPKMKVVAQGTLKEAPTIKSRLASLPVPKASISSVVASPAAVPPSKLLVTTIAAKIDVGLGNALFIRGQGDGLSWDKGTALQCVDASTWIWSTNRAQGKVVFKLLVNDQVWSQGADLVVEAGTKAEIVPVF